MSTPPPSRPKTYFEQQRETLLTEISLSLENVLTGLNTLNRGIEGVVSVGRELEGAETLWRQFEKGVMEGQGVTGGTEEQTGEGAGGEGRS